MIELRTTVSDCETEYLYGVLREEAHDCLAAHAYKQAIAELEKKSDDEYQKAERRNINTEYWCGRCDTISYLKERASSLLAQWMGET